MLIQPTDQVQPTPAVASVPRPVGPVVQPVATGPDDPARHRARAGTTRDRSRALAFSARAAAG